MRNGFYIVAAAIVAVSAPAFAEAPDTQLGYGAEASFIRVSEEGPTTDCNGRTNQPCAVQITINSRDSARNAIVTQAIRTLRQRPGFANIFAPQVTKIQNIGGTKYVVTLNFRKYNPNVLN